MKNAVREKSFRWSDPRELGLRLAERDGLDWLQAMKAGELPPPPAAEALGFEIEEIGAGTAVFSMSAQEWMCNPAAVIHGGLIATLLDTVLTLAVVTKLPRGKSCQTVQLNLNFVRPLLPTGERVRAVGEAVHVGTTIGTAEGRVFNAAGKMIAHGTATLALLAVEAMQGRPGRPAGDGRGATRSPASP